MFITQTIQPDKARALRRPDMALRSCSSDLLCSQGPRNLKYRYVGLHIDLCCSLQGLGSTDRMRSKCGLRNRLVVCVRAAGQKQWTSEHESSENKAHVDTLTCMHPRTHAHTGRQIFVCLKLFLSIDLSIYLSIDLSIYLPTYLYKHVYMHIPVVYLGMCLLNRTEQFRSSILASW